MTRPGRCVNRAPQLPLGSVTTGDGGLHRCVKTGHFLQRLGKRMGK